MKNKNKNKKKVATLNYFESVIEPVMLKSQINDNIGLEYIKLLDKNIDEITETEFENITNYMNNLEIRTCDAFYFAGKYKKFLYEQYDGRFKNCNKIILEKIKDRIDLLPEI